MAWHAVELDRLTTRLEQLIVQERALHKQYAQSQADLHLLDQQTRQHLQARDKLQQELERYSLQMQAELSAQEAKLQSYAAQSMVALSEKEAQLQEFSERSQQALTEKEAQLQNERLEKLQLQKDLDTLQHSRLWRWGQSVLRIMGRSQT
jgi:seryl-tRNA synthetase